MSWTDIDINLMRELVAQGKSASFIAAQIGKTRSAVCGKLHRLGIKMKPDKKKKPGEVASKLKKEKKPATPRRKKYVPVVPKVLMPHPVSLLEAKENHCRWIRDDGLCCGNPRFKDFSYCEQHVKYTHIGKKRRVIPE